MDPHHGKKSIFLNSNWRCFCTFVVKRWLAKKIWYFEPRFKEKLRDGASESLKVDPLDPRSDLRVNN